MLRLPDLRLFDLGWEAGIKYGSCPPKLDNREYQVDGYAHSSTKGEGFGFDGTKGHYR